MENVKIVENFLQAIERNEFTKAETFLSKDFKVTGVTPDPIGAKEYLGVHKALGKGIPNFRFNYKFGKTQGDVVSFTVQLTGTQTRDLPAPIPGINDIPATNKSVKMPLESLQATVKDNRITILHLESVPGGGLPGLLKQLGVEIPEPEHTHHH